MPDSAVYTLERSSFYTILGLPEPQRLNETRLSSDDLKAAYRQALLLNHPDKTAQRKAFGIKNYAESPPKYTLDEITKAYERLANPQTKAVYDQGLLQERHQTRLAKNNNINPVTRSTAEVLDLEELDYDEASQIWSRLCRCGGLYQITESQLEEATADDEVSVACQGCSLYIRVIFSTVND